MDVIHKYFPDLSVTQKNQFESMLALYKDWNEKVNVISRKDIDQLYERHVLHSLAILKFTDFNKNSTVVDVGTGGGFPGIPLAIMRPEVQFILVDSIIKKLRVVQDVADKLELKNVKVYPVRIEESGIKADYIVSRAVTALPAFLNLVKRVILKSDKKLGQRKIIYLKGGDFSDEISVIQKKILVSRISDVFEEEFFKEKFVLTIPW